MQATHQLPRATKGSKTQNTTSIPILESVRPQVCRGDWGQDMVCTPPCSSVWNSTRAPPCHSRGASSG
jgi:hypothetical protein